MKRPRSVLAMAMAVLLGVPAVGATQGRGVAEAVKPLVQTAAKEGQLNLVWSSYFLDNGTAVKQFQDAFNQHFGLNVTITFTPSPNLPQLVNRLLQEAQAGHPATTDLFVGAPPLLLALMNGKVLQPVEWRRLVPSIPEAAVAPDNLGVAWSSYFAGVDYNTRAVPAEEVPRKLQDVLKPKWKGRIASTPYAASLDRLALYTGRERMYGFVQELARQVAGLIRCTDLDRIANGEFDMLVFDCGVFAAQTAARNGLPIGFSILEDATYIDYWYLAVPKGSKHPNTAILFSLFLLSPEGQRLSYKTDFLDLHLLPGSQSRKLIQPILDKGVKLHGEPGVRDLVGRPEVLQYRTDFPRMLRTK